jgi:probable F420-dependent oxidoreductase
MLGDFAAIESSDESRQLSALPTLGAAGIWTRALDTVSGGEAQEAVAELEDLGYGAVWIPEAIQREVMSHATLLLAGSTSIVVATGIANIHARAPRSAALAQDLLTQRFPGRFMLGLGVSHAFVVERVLHQSYGSPLQTMSAYLDVIDATLADQQPRVLAALGPKMLTLAKERALGAHTYMSPVEHTAWAREVLGTGPLLVPAVKAVLDSDVARARELGASAVAPTLRMPAYRENLRRLGFGDPDVAGRPSTRVVDALVAHGGVDEIVDAVRAHLAAGADHVCVELLCEDGEGLPSAAWRELAPALTSLGS